MVVVFVLHLSTATSTTNEVGMKGAWAGLVDVFDIGRTNILDGPLTSERQSGSSENTNDDNGN